jgi:hypothetical protein
LRTANSRAVRVTNPQRVAFSPTSTTAVVVDEDGGFSVIDLPSLTDLEYERRPQGATGKGAEGQG